MRHSLLTSYVLLAACVGGPEIDDRPDVASGDAQSPLLFFMGETDQGIYILGSQPDGLFDGSNHYRVGIQAMDPGHAGYRLSVTPAKDGASLIASNGTTTRRGADPWFEDMILNGVPGGQIRIERVVADSGLTKYYLKHRLGTTGQPWTDYCGDPEMYAVPLRGHYDQARVHFGGESISFACENGVAAKCTKWKYVAGNIGPGDHDWNRHQACTLMANAKYCGQAPPMTRELTPILIRDYDGNPFPYPQLLRPDPLPGNPDAYYFEAGWRVSPVFGPVCLSKLRWAALSPAACMNDLPDPRIPGSEGKFCDDMTPSELRAAGALLVNASKVMDAPLHVWRNSKTGDVVTTMRGYHAEGEQVAPFTDYDQHLGIDSLILRNLPGTLDEDAMTKLYLFEHPTTGDRFVATEAAGTGFRNLGFEGYAFPTQQFPSLIPLRLCKATGAYNTTVATCGTGVAATELGWVMPRP